MTRVVQLVHWKPLEAKERIQSLKQAGYEVRYVEPDPKGMMRHLRAGQFDAILIDLSRMPSHGREVGRACRRSPKLREIPLVFVDGDAEKVAAIRQMLPDATYTSWKKIGAALRKAIASPPVLPVRPSDGMSQFHGKPLAAKLGVKAGMTVALLRAPEEFRLEGEPDGVSWQGRVTAQAALVIWFVRTYRELDEGLALLAPRLRVPLWIAWPKQKSKQAPDLSFPVIRKLTRNLGLRESKICAIDDRWSGVRLTAP